MNKRVECKENIHKENVSKNWVKAKFSNKQNCLKFVMSYDYSGLYECTKDDRSLLTAKQRKDVNEVIDNRKVHEAD